MVDQFTDDEMSALIDGEASDELRARAAQDSEAATQIEAAREMEARLRQRLYRQNCPPAQRLGEYVLKRVPAHEVENIARHLAMCVRCREEVEGLKAFLDSPDEFEDYGPMTASIRRAGPRYQAVRQVEVGAMRGEDEGYSQVLEHESFTIFLEARQSAGGVLLTGQIVASDTQAQQQWTDALIEIRQAEGLLATSTVDEAGEFRFRGLKPDPVEIALTTEAGSSIWLGTEPLLPDAGD